MATSAPPDPNVKQPGTYDTAAAFEKLLPRLKVDIALVKRIHRYRLAFATRNADHVAFLGSNLLGVYPFRFTERMREEWFDDVIRIDESAVKHAISTVPYIDPEWKRISDSMNQLCVWLLHVMYHSKLPQRDKIQCMKDIATILQYKLLSSTLAHTFKFPADKAVAQAASDAMSRKFLFKQLGSWGALVDYRTNEIIGIRDGVILHQNTIRFHGPDEAIGYMISDIQQRLKDYVKNLTDLFYQIREKGVAVYTTSTTIEVSGETLVKDKQRAFSNYSRYIHSVLGDRKTFIKDELVKVVADLQHTAPVPRLVEALTWLSDNHRVPGSTEVEKLVDEVLIHAYGIVKSEPTLRTGRSIMAPLLAKLRALYMASRMADPTLLDMRIAGDAVVRKAVNSKNESVLASVRTALLLYIVLRTFTMEHYS